MTAVKDFLGIRVEKNYVGISKCHGVLRVREMEYVAILGELRCEVGVWTYAGCKRGASVVSCVERV